MCRPLIEIRHFSLIADNKTPKLVILAFLYR